MHDWHWIIGTLNRFLLETDMDVQIPSRESIELRYLVFYEDDAVDWMKGLSE